jgi:SAM-dependent methyltransferase
MTQGRVQAQIFGEVADDYDRLRPEYPAELIEQIIAFAQPHDALEVGAGTGKATRAFAGHGFRITAIEPDHDMAAVLRRRTGVEVVETPFEQFRPGRTFDLLYSAQAWHWVDPAVRWERAAEILRPRGTIALIWNLDRIADPALLTAIGPVYRKYAPNITPNAELTDEQDLPNNWPGPDLRNLTEFTDVRYHLYRWERELSRDDYLDYLATQSPYRMLASSVRDALLTELRAAIPEPMRVGVDTVGYLARRAA